MIDDDKAILRLVETKLKKAGYAVAAYSDGDEAFDAIVESPPAFVVTDWDMPGLDGLELCRKLRSLEQSNYIYVIILTGRTGSEELIHAFEAGADDFVSKEHFDFEELVARLVAAKRIIYLERRLRQMAQTDSLTGLLNRRSFLHAARVEWERASRYQLPLSFVMVDLDFFKRVNDVHGHGTGDAVLRDAAILLTDSSRTSDQVGRFGGEEFCVMLPETNEQGAAVWAERVRESIARYSFGGDLRLKITASFGIAERSDPRLALETLIDHADQACLAAKERGRDCIITFESLHAANGRDGTMQGDLSSMLAGVRAVDIMAPTSEPLEESSTVHMAVEQFLQAQAEASPVTGPDGHLVGWVTAQEILSTLTQKESLEQSISRLGLTSTNVITFESDAPARAVFDFFARVSVPLVMICDDGRLVGTISRMNILRWVLTRLVGLGHEESLHDASSVLDPIDASDPNPTV